MAASLTASTTSSFNIFVLVASYQYAENYGVEEGRDHWKMKGGHEEAICSFSVRAINEMLNDTTRSLSEHLDAIVKQSEMGFGYSNEAVSFTLSNIELVNLNDSIIEEVYEELLNASDDMDYSWLQFKSAHCEMAFDWAMNKLAEQGRVSFNKNQYGPFRMVTIH